MVWITSSLILLPCARLRHMLLRSRRKKRAWNFMAAAAAVLVVWLAAQKQTDWMKNRPKQKIGSRPCLPLPYKLWGVIMFFITTSPPCALVKEKGFSLWPFIKNIKILVTQLCAAVSFQCYFTETRQGCDELWLPVSPQLTFLTHFSLSQ